MTLALVQNIPPLLEYVKLCDPSFRIPYHLASFTEILEAAPRSGMRAMCSVPIRHYKTWTVICAIAWWLKKDPTLRIIYMTYGIIRAEEVGKDIRDICRHMGVGPEKGHDTIKLWSNEHGGGVAVMSADQSKLGADCDILIWDDPIEGPVQADDQKIRDLVDKTIAFYTNRLQRGGACIGVMSRFHPDDPIGRRMLRGWRYEHKRAIEHLGTDHETAFAPDVFTLEEIKAKRVEMKETDPNERTFFGQWQNDPKPVTLSHFHPPARYLMLPTWPGFRDAMGLDMSFSRSKRADWASIVVTRWWRRDCYVRLLKRVRADLGDVTREVIQLRNEYGRMPIFSYVSGPEYGAIMHMQLMGIPVIPIQASAPKFVRGQRTIDSHNAARILWPSEPWVDHVYSRLENFRGNEDDPDDEADALVSVHDGMMSTGGTGNTRSLGSWRY